MNNQGGQSSHRIRLGPGAAICVLAAAIYLTAIFSPPSLMDDVDAVQAQIAKNMIESGDWVTARLNGIVYLEKPPLKYWMIAVCYLIFGVHDWAARIPVALSVVMLCWVTYRIGLWAFGGGAGLFAGVALACSVGMWLFTRVQISEAILTLAVTVAMWSFLRALDAEERRPRLWSTLLAVSIGCGLLVKGLIAAVFPAAAGFLYLMITRQLTARRTWQRLRPASGIAIILLIAAPWHVLATLRNPPYLDLTMKSEPGAYHGFFWFYFLNEHLFRFLGTRYPKDYAKVPLLLFWSLHLLWLFPWSAFVGGTVKLGYRPVDRAGQTRLLALCWAGFVLAFFSLSTSQEYYTMPAYPAVALLLGCALASDGRAVGAGRRVLAVLSLAAGLVLAAILGAVWDKPAPGDISLALTRNPELYTLSLGHMADLTLDAFAYLRLPVLLAALALLAGGAAAWRLRGERMVLALAAMMLVVFQAARLALVAFDPYLSSRPLAEALQRAPAGDLIVDNQYYAFSSVFFYADTNALLLNGRVTNLEYGSYAPGAPDVFIDDEEFRRLWLEPRRWYLCVEGRQVNRIESLVGRENLHTVQQSGGKFLLVNQPD